MFVRDPRHAHHVLAGVRCNNGRQQYSLSADEALAFIEERLEHLLEVVAPTAGSGAERMPLPPLLP